MSKDANLTLNSTNIISWQESFEKTIFPYGPFAKAIKNKTKYIQILPKKADLDEDGDHIYTGSWTSTDPVRYVLNEKGSNLYQTKLENKQIKNEKELAQNDALMSHMFAHISNESQITIRSHPEYQEAYLNVDTFKMWDIINSTHRKGSAKTALKKFREFMSLKMESKSHQQFMYELKQLEETTLENFSDTINKRMIPIDYLTAAIYIGGLDSKKNSLNNFPMVDVIIYGKLFPNSTHIGLKKLMILKSLILVAC